MGLALCFIAFVLTYWASRKSLGLGLAATIGVGYFYGILRANFLDGFSHFIFDSAVLALYGTQLLGKRARSRFSQNEAVVGWLYALIGWPLIWFFVPINHPLIQLVGLRAAIFFVPFILLGAGVERSDLRVLTELLSVLNVAVLGVAVSEYFWGLEWIYPVNDVTEVIFLSKDVADREFYRIPATFIGSHAYGGAMVATAPLFLGRVQSASPRERWLSRVGLCAAGMGAFMCGARQPVVVLFVLIAAMLISSRLDLKGLVALVGVGGIVAYIVATSERFQRFMTLQDTEYVVRRVGASVNLGVVESVIQYPIGVGLGGAAGTSIPYFLSSYMDRQTGAENEFARVAMEQSVVGLVLWLAFIFYTVFQRVGHIPGWKVEGRSMQLLIAVSWGAAVIGTGKMMTIPTTALLLLQMGVLASVPRRSVTWAEEAGQRRRRQSQVVEGV